MLFRSNLEDCALVLDIFEATELIDFAVQRSCLTGLEIDRQGGSVAAFDYLYLPRLHRSGYIAPVVDESAIVHSPGGYVLDSEPGLYSDVVVLDFKSLYPSIIRTFHVDPLAMVAPGEDRIPGFLGASFSKEHCILPQIIEELWQARDEAKRNRDAALSQAVKILMNSFYGVLATGACRFADDELAGAITEFGHYILRWTRDWLERQPGCRVLYGDTDSVFVDCGLPDDCLCDVAQRRGGELCAAANAALAGHIAERYGVASRLELEFEKHYVRFLLPPMRGSDKGRAKGYAGWRMGGDEGYLEIVGMEAVRRDWTALAHQLQRELLGLLFADADAARIEALVSECVRSVRAGERDGELVYHKGLRKPVSSYTRNVPPHVQAARLLPKPRGVIHYAITCEGPQPVGHVRAPLDYDHYVEKQIEPLVRTIAQVYPLDVEAAIRGVGNLFDAGAWAKTKERPQS